MGKFCDDGCDVIFRSKKVHVVKDKPEVDKLLQKIPTVLLGNRNRTNNLWDTTLPQSSINQATSNDPYPINTMDTSTPLPPGHPSIYLRHHPKVLQVMEASNANADDASVALFKTKDDMDRAVLNLLPSSSSFSKPANPLPPHLQAMDALISVNECNTLVDQQLKLDRTGSISPNYSNPFQGLNQIIDEFHSQSLSSASITPEINVVISKDTTKRDLMQYYHGCLLWPVKSTLHNAIKMIFFLPSLV